MTVTSSGMLEAMETILSSENDLPYIPEPIFVNEFLPMFAGEKVKLSIDDWLTVSHNHYNQVRVINPAGETLFIVPPLLRQLNFRSSGPESSIHEIAQTAKNKAEQSPRLAVGYLSAQVKGKVINAPIDPFYITQWNDIFKRYGYQQLEVPEDVLRSLSISSPDSVTAEADGDITGSESFEEL